jgi:hypothetical protein
MANAATSTVSVRGDRCPRPRLCSPGLSFAVSIGVTKESKPPEEKRGFLRFPYVCPEPVLVKCSFLCTNGSKRPF